MQSGVNTVDQLVSQAANRCHHRLYSPRYRTRKGGPSVRLHLPTIMPAFAVIPAEAGTHRARIDSILALCYASAREENPVGTRLTSCSVTLFTTPAGGFDHAPK